MLKSWVRWPRHIFLMQYKKLQIRSWQTLTSPKRRKGELHSEYEVICLAGTWRIVRGCKKRGRERILLLKSHRDKRIDDWSDLVLLQLNYEGVLGVGKSRYIPKAGFGGIIDFN